jgi:hypothetical protein
MEVKEAKSLRTFGWCVVAGEKYTTFPNITQITSGDRCAMTNHIDWFP